VTEHTRSGTPVYKASQPQLQAIRETDRREALREFAVGEAERMQAAINRDREEQRLRNAAAPILFIRGKAFPAILLAACVGAATLWWNRIVALFH
jgi:hypothetical protein